MYVIKDRNGRYHTLSLAMFYGGRSGYAPLYYVADGSTDRAYTPEALDHLLKDGTVVEVPGPWTGYDDLVFSSMDRPVN